MPIYSFMCVKHGEFDGYFLRPLSETPQKAACPVCDKPSRRVFSAPALVKVNRSWNEKANDWQRNPYEQAKAQLTNKDREQQERGERPLRITEESIQVAAAEIAKEQSRPNVDTKAKRQLKEST